MTKLNCSYFFPVILYDKNTIYSYSRVWLIFLLFINIELCSCSESTSARLSFYATNKEYNTTINNCNNITCGTPTCPCVGLNLTISVAKNSYLSQNQSSTSVFLYLSAGTYVGGNNTNLYITFPLLLMFVFLLCFYHQNGELRQ